MISREDLLSTVNSHINKEEYKITKLSDIFINEDFEIYTDEFYYNSACIVEELLRIVGIDEEEAL